MERYVVRIMGTSRYIVSFLPSLRTTPTIGGRLTKQGVTGRALLFHDEGSVFREIGDYLSKTDVKVPKKFEVVMLEGPPVKVGRKRKR